MRGKIKKFTPYLKIFRGTISHNISSDVYYQHNLHKKPQIKMVQSKKLFSRNFCFQNQNHCGAKIMLTKKFRQINFFSKSIVFTKFLTNKEEIP